jgi:hypothetical protein
MGLGSFEAGRRGCRSVAADAPPRNVLDGAYELGIVSCTVSTSRRPETSSTLRISLPSEGTSNSRRCPSVSSWRRLSSRVRMTVESRNSHDAAGRFAVEQKRLDLNELAQIVAGFDWLRRADRSPLALS